MMLLNQRLHGVFLQQWTGAGDSEVAIVEHKD